MATVMTPLVLATLPPPTSEHSPRSESKAPRYRRIGGYVMTHKTAEKWAERLLGKELDPVFASCATQIINPRIKQYGARVRTIGEEYRTHCMIITQSARFRGYVGMPAEEIPQFEPGEREKRAKEFLEAQGVEDISFETWLD